MSVYRCNCCLNNYYCISENCNGCEGCLTLDKDGICEDCIENDRNSKELVKKLFEHLDNSVESLEMSIANVEVTK
jgi:hypothetical protein